MYDIAARKIRTVSINDCTVKEDTFPMRIRAEWQDKSLDLPVDFQPSIDAFLNSNEWDKYDFDDIEELEAAKICEWMMESAGNLYFQI